MAKTRAFKSMKDELVKKSREAMLAAVQIYNNPAITFKAESYITLCIISWTYLMHAFYRSKNIDYRFYTMTGTRKKYDKTKHGAYKSWDLETCLNKKECPLDVATKANLKFLIGLRHEIEHQMTTRIDEIVSAKTHAAAINFNYYIKELFGNKYGIDDDLALCIQFSKIEPSNKVKELNKMKGLSENIRNYILEFENTLNEELLKDTRYSYRVMYVQLNANRVGQADAVVEFVKLTPEQEKILTDQILVKETEKKKYLPGQIVAKMQEEGYKTFKMHQHTVCWKELSSDKHTLTQYGTTVADGTWYWYENWISYVRSYCENNFEKN